MDQRRSLESADAGLSVIKEEEGSEFQAVRRTKPGKYSNTSRYFKKKHDYKRVCPACSSSKFSRSKKCPALALFVTSEGVSEGHKPAK